MRRTLSPLVRGVASLAALALFFLVPSGCSRQDATAPGRTGSVAEILAPVLPDVSAWDGALHGDPARGFYPLAIGNHWEYEIRLHSVLVNDQGPQPPEDAVIPWVAEITGTESLDGREYFLQSEGDPRVVGPPQPAIRVRQDRAGLYEHDFPVDATALAREGETGAGTLRAALLAGVERSIAASPQREAFQRAAVQVAARIEWLRMEGLRGRHGPPGGPGLHEIQMLRYPLHVGAQWIVRDSPRFTRHVLARERVSLPAGGFTTWRIAGDSELFGRNDRLTLWYAPQGLVRMRVHAESIATDANGNPIGHIAMDSDQVLTRVELSGPRLEVAGR